MLCWEPKPGREERLLGPKLKVGAGIHRYRHQGSIQLQIEQVPAIAAPMGLRATLARNLPLAAPAGKIPNVYFQPPGFMRRVGEPSGRLARLRR